ncbi:flagellar hook-basal body protein [Variovorax arabinosiphilus]|uniref:flagellar hook-basal body protein n=1 Tax=Variovorax arabinosiphilus TaxID=3053498 RepID=UPI0025784B18|nr:MULTISPECIES: flagellar hook-basal body protein [unclassified Variovorax]MDM0122182.1 flagellar hook-basal body protein [Variovorax sp. J2L1-78]MDM0131289.1 flagellar hook-basal body protein [Variovorax sp. J2L1-63]MDM0234945.1 flagellar hook-basal body protein [Variovorax sp. J2R1-6]
MSDVLAISLHGMQQEMARVQRISMNMANATTPGYKRDVAYALPLGGDFAATVDALQNDGISRRAARFSGAGVDGLVVRSDTRPSTLRTTGQSLDVALSSTGYFEVATDDGPAYTRQGNWSLDARGRLVTAQGHPVMGQGGEIVLTRPNPVIDAAGRVFEANGRDGAEAVPVAQLKVVQFEGLRALRPLGNGLVHADQPPSQLPDGDVQVRQGFLENSNVNSMHEMVQLIQSMRHFESMQKVALGYDDMLGSAIRKLGDAA